jgi:hypothetical protein
VFFRAVVILAHLQTAEIILTQIRHSSIRHSSFVTVICRLKMV